MNMVYRITVITIAAVALCLIGCSEERVPANINSYMSSPQEVLSQQRVVFVELMDETGQASIAEDMTYALAQAIQERGLFRIDVIGRLSPQLEGLPIDKREPFTMAELDKIRRQLRCDAVIIGSVSNFQPYPRMQISMLIRLLDLRDGQLEWAVDEKWDSAEVVVEKRIQQYFDDHLRSGYDPAYWELVIRSPKHFCRFVAFETANTLPDACRPYRITDRGLN